MLVLQYLQGVEDDEDVGHDDGKGHQDATQPRQPEDRKQHQHGFHRRPVSFRQKKTNTSRNVNICSLTAAIISPAAGLRVPRSRTSHQASPRNPSEIPLHPPLLNSVSKLFVASRRRLSGFGRQRVPYTTLQRLGRLTG